jgi:hypothetical protein
MIRALPGKHENDLAALFNPQPSSCDLIAGSKNSLMDSAVKPQNDHMVFLFLYKTAFCSV